MYPERNIKITYHDEIYVDGYMSPSTIFGTFVRRFSHCLSVPFELKKLFNTCLSLFFFCFFFFSVSSFTFDSELSR